MHRGCFVWTPTPPLVGRRTPRLGPVRGCACSFFLARSGGPASRARSGEPHLFLWPLCLPALLGPLRAWVAPLLFLCLPSPPPPFLLRCSLCGYLLSLAFSGFRPLVPWALALCFSFPPPPVLWVFFVFLCLLSLSLSAPVVSALLWSLALGALGLGALCCLFCWSPASRLSVRSRRLWGSCLAVGCSLVVAAPPPLLWSAVSVAAALCPAWFFLFFSLLCSCLRARCSSAVLVVCFPPPPPLVCFAGLPLLGSPCAPAAFVFPARPLAASLCGCPPPPPPSVCGGACYALVVGSRRLLPPPRSSCLFCWSPAEAGPAAPRPSSAQTS